MAQCKCHFFEGKSAANGHWLRPWLSGTRWSVKVARVGGQSAVPQDRPPRSRCESLPTRYIAVEGHERVSSRLRLPPEFKFTSSLRGSKRNTWPFFSPLCYLRYNCRCAVVKAVQVRTRCVDIYTPQTLHMQLRIAKVQLLCFRLATSVLVQFNGRMLYCPLIISILARAALLPYHLQGDICHVTFEIRDVRANALLPLPLHVSVVIPLHLPKGSRTDRWTREQIDVRQREEETSQKHPAAALFAPKIESFARTSR